MDAVTVRLEVAEWLRAAAGSAGPGPAAAAEQLLDALAAAGVPAHLAVTVPIPAVPGSAAAGPSPVDPIEALAAVAGAVAQAEKALNAQNLAIAAGAVEASLLAAVDGQPGARTRIALTLSPRPQT